MRMSNRLAEHYRAVADRYRLATGATEYEVSEVVAWGQARGELDLPPEEVQVVLMERMSEALRSDAGTDKFGRKVRLRHCVEIMRNGGDRRLCQRTLWAHVDDARDEFLYESLVQRRRRIGADVNALRADLDYINARRAARGLRPIQMTFDFDADAAFGQAGA
jgi:hypothetical protein